MTGLLSKADISAVNNWHWPLTESGVTDPFAKIDCSTPEMQDYRKDLLKRRFKHAFNTFCKYKDEKDIAQARACWVIHTIAQISEFDESVIPDSIQNIIPDCIRYHSIEKECSEKASLRKKILKAIEIYASTVKKNWTFY